MSDSIKGGKIPLYSIDIFKSTPEHPYYQVEVFTKDRDFKVLYPHRHDFYELLFITAGSGTYTIDFNEYPIEPNKLFFVSPGQVHTIRFSDDIDGYIFLFTSEFYLFNKQDLDKLSALPFYNQFSGNNPPLVITNGEDVVFIKELFIKACAEQTKNDADSEDMARALLDVILIFCKRNYPDAFKEEKHLKRKQIMLQFSQLVERNYLKNLSVKDYALMLNITPSHLNETIKKQTGKTASDLIDTKMILEIKRMLLHTDLNVSEIAAKFNFIDQSYFSKYFKKFTVQSPLEFRNTFNHT